MIFEIDLFWKLLEVDFDTSLPDCPPKTDPHEGASQNTQGMYLPKKSHLLHLIIVFA